MYIFVLCRKNYRIPKSCNKQSNDIADSKVIKGQDNKLRFLNNKVMDVWTKYFEKLLNNGEVELNV